MTTPPTPADWYPDPENPSGLRYWDGTAWTEHRAPAPTAAAEPPAAAPPASPPADDFPGTEQATSVVSLPDSPTSVVRTRPTGDTQDAGSDESLHGAHRAPDETQQEPSQPYDTHPKTSWDAPMPSWDAPTGEAEPEPTPAPTPTQSFSAPSYEAPSYETPSYETPSYEAPSYDAPAAAAAPPSYEAAAFAPPPGSPPGGYEPTSGPGGQKPNGKLVAGILGGGLAILIVIAVVIALAVMKQPEPTVSSQGTSTPATSTTSSETSTESSSPTSSAGSPTMTPPPTGGEATDGDYTFSVAGTDTGDTITSNVSDQVQTTADGMFYVVYVNVKNTGTSPLTFVATFQQLGAQGQTFPLDDEATAFLGGTIADIQPGDQVQTPLVYDVPVGTTPDTILLRADPASPGATLPLQ
jgi:hypothetical protein